MSGTGRRHRRRARRMVLVVAAVVLAAAATTVAFGFHPRLGGGDGDRDTGAHLPPATAQVSRQTLVDAQTEDGTLGYGSTRTANAKLGGTITALPAVGATVKRGQALYAVDNAKVVLLYGKLPTYRALQTGVEGPDVKQFEQNLKALGYSGFTVDDEYGSSTAEAVKEWQDDLGLAETGRVDLGRIVYADGPVRVDGHEKEVGDSAEPGGAVLTFTGTSRVVSVELDVNDQRLAQKDAKVTVTLPSNRKVDGKITLVETVIKPASGQDPAETKIDVTVAISDAKSLVGLDEASVKVGFTASERKDVLTVPVAALVALPEGGYGVQVVDGGTTHMVSVQTGLFASGRVEVSGDGLAEGASVGMPA